jgi:hypothetical protein
VSASRVDRWHLRDGVGVQARNAILVAMEDLAKADRKELEKELEEEMTEMWRWKLVCF